MNDPPPAEILRRARPIPTYRDHPASSPVDVTGVDPSGAPVHVPILGNAEPVLLLFLSAGCLGCRDLWEGTDDLRRFIPEGIRIVIVVKGPEHEDAAAIAALAPADVATVMSSQAYLDYRVGGPPFLVLVTGHEVLTEGVAWGIEETARAARHALEGSGLRHGRSAPVVPGRAIAGAAEAMSHPPGMLAAKKEGHPHARTAPVQPGQDGTTHH